MRIPGRTTLFVVAVVALFTGMAFLPIHGQSPLSTPDSAQSTPAAPPTVPASPFNATNTIISSDQLIKLGNFDQARALIRIYSAGEGQQKVLIDKLLAEITARADGDRPAERKLLAEKLQQLVEDLVQKEVTARLQTPQDFTSLGNFVVGGGGNEVHLLPPDGTGRISTLPFMQTLGRPASEQWCEENTRALLATFGQFTNENRHEFLEKLKPLVIQHFDAKQAAREAKLAQLEEQLNKLRTLHAQRAKEKSKIVSDRIEQLTREAAGLGWTGEHSTNSDDLVRPTGGTNSQ